MVKGISRRVVVVHPTESKLFEQAIFIVKEQPRHSSDVLHEACGIVEKYLGKSHVKRYTRKRWTNFHLALSMLAGAGMMAGVWGYTVFYSISLF